MELNPQNIREAIRKLKESTNKIPDSSCWLLPTSEKVLSKKKYSGKGRPKKEDYDYKKIKWFNKLKEIKQNEKTN